jgi:hypothetical protein
LTLIMTLAITCFRNKSELESADYYVRELKFQSQINASANSRKLSSPVTHDVRRNEVSLHFPIELSGKHVRGSVAFIRPSDSFADWKTVLNPDPQGHQEIIHLFIKGVYRMEVDFTCEGVDYYSESVINFP